MNTNNFEPRRIQITGGTGSFGRKFVGEIYRRLPGVQRVGKVVHRMLRHIAGMVTPKRPARSCPRKMRQPVSSWPRLIKNTYKSGAPECELFAITT